MIPRIIHRVWLGGKPMPAFFSQCGESWTCCHPEWTMRTWTEKEVAGLQNSDLLSRCSSLAQQSDIARYEILMREGGVYVDTDIECLKNIDPLIEGLDFFGCWQKDGVLSNAVMGGVPGHPVFEDLFRESRSFFKADPWNAMGPPFLTEIVKRYPDARIFERKTFIPFTWQEYYAFYPDWPARNPAVPVESYAINHRSSIWYPDSKKRRIT